MATLSCHQDAIYAVFIGHHAIVTMLVGKTIENQAANSPSSEY